MCWPIPPFLLVQTATCCESWHAKIKRAIFNVWELFARCFLNGFDEFWLWLSKRGDRRCFYSVTAWGFRLCLKNGIFVAVITVVAGLGFAGFWGLLSLTSCCLPPSIPLASLGIQRKYLNRLSPPHWWSSWINHRIRIQCSVGNSLLSPCVGLGPRCCRAGVAAGTSPALGPAVGWQGRSIESAGPGANSSNLSTQEEWV